MHNEQDPVGVYDHKNVKDMTPILRKFNDLVWVEKWLGMHKKLKNRGTMSWTDM